MSRLLSSHWSIQTFRYFSWLPWSQTIQRECTPNYDVKCQIFMIDSKSTQAIWHCEVFWKNVFGYYIMDILNICKERILVEGLMFKFTFLFSMIVAGKLINQLHTSPSMNKFQNKSPATLKYFNLSELWMNSEINTWSKSEELILHWQYMNCSWLSAVWNVKCKRSLKHYLLSN